MIFFNHIRRHIGRLPFFGIHENPAGNAIQQLIAVFIKEEEAAVCLKAGKFIAPGLQCDGFIVFWHAVEL